MPFTITNVRVRNATNPQEYINPTFRDFGGDANKCWFTVCADSLAQNQVLLLVKKRGEGGLWSFDPSPVVMNDDVKVTLGIQASRFTMVSRPAIWENRVFRLNAEVWVMEEDERAKDLIKDYVSGTAGWVNKKLKSTAIARLKLEMDFDKVDVATIAVAVKNG